MKDKSTITVFLDDEVQPIATFESPVRFELDTRKLVDGDHVLRIVSKDPTGKEGIRIMPFVVRNGPAIEVEGIKENAVVDGILPLMINAYGKGNQKEFLIVGSESPKSIPSWVWVITISFIAWAIFYLARYLTIRQ
ncbi:MAG: cytochrome C [Hydrotalea flava]|uniref:cytochrome C n=1 Tax=Hydrotalea TaxID=1004300 RepID=UPI000944B993|nr:MULTISPECIES: cytochrome C [Hydrotalea]MBY0347606.1 cytochrome C [Hydrotalea flava]NIM36679.1 cytochrome C [Hydrotalea flava]NIM39539.1 cytochrome C [Hydrotalea flava]NIN04728.1 cytochrome C [Hydrotalea flava]NIN16400.1 cytochrome C [Hydrotalea flava]